MLDSDEMVAAGRDTTIASAIAVVGVTLLYFGMFKGVTRPLLALGTLLIAACWSLGFTTLTVGHLNIFSIALDRKSTRLNSTRFAYTPLFRSPCWIPMRWSRPGGIRRSPVPSLW